MGLFGKNKKEEGSNFKLNGMPSLPELPKLPELPQTSSPNSSTNVSSAQTGTVARPNALPRFPSGSLGDKFSQNTIKDAVSGEKEGDVVNEFENEIQKMPQPDKAHTKKREKIPARASPPPMRAQPMQEPQPEIQDEIPTPHEPQAMPNQVPASPSVMTPSRGYSPQRNSASNEPVFIRIDKFEESMDTFEKIKKQISGVDKLLNEVKQIKEKEEKEMQDWQQKLESMKSQIEKIDRDIFSKIE